MFKDKKIFDWYGKRQIAKSSDNLESALSLKKHHKFNQCIQKLVVLSTTGNLDDQLIACYELATLHSQMGNHSTADKYLRRLHFKYKLSPNILCPNFVDLKSDSDTLNKVAVFDNAIPKSLLTALRVAFDKDSSFWSEHNYPTKQFFSYNMPVLHERTKSENIMQQLISHLKPIVSAAFPAKQINKNVESVEWWCHVRSETTSTAHQLHFDLDEVALASRMSGGGTKDGGDSIHPLVSSVLYLNECCDNLAPTLLTNQTLDEDSVASESWLCQPAENRLLLFDGDLLHGVVPYLSPETLKGNGDSLSIPAPRITLMIGWWGAGVHTSQPKRDQHFLGPNMRMPSSSGNQEAIPSSINSTSSSVTGWNISIKKPIVKLDDSAPIKSDVYRCPYVNTTVTWPLALRCSDTVPPLVNHAPVQSSALQRVEGPVWVRVRRANESRPTVTALRRSLYGFESSPGPDFTECDNDQTLSENVTNATTTSTGSSRSIKNTSNDIVEYMSIAELNKLRESGNTTSSGKRSRKDAMVAPFHTASSSSAVEFMSIADLNKLRDEQKSSKSNKKSRQEIAPSVPESDGIEYVSIEELTRLRGGDKKEQRGVDSFLAEQKERDLAKFDSSGAFIGSTDRLTERRERRRERMNEARDSVAFFGRWFLRDLSDIYEEVVRGSSGAVECDDE